MAEPNLLRYEGGVRTPEINSPTGSPVWLSSGARGQIIDENGAVLNVMARGARGDGTTDDAGSIQAALDEISAAGGGEVIIPRGLWRLRSRLTISHDNVTLRGKGGAVILPDWSSGTEDSWISIGAVSNPLKDITLADLLILPQGTLGRRTRVSSVDGFRAHNITMRGGAWALDIRHTRNIEIINVQGAEQQGVVSLINSDYGSLVGVVGDRVNSAVDWGGGARHWSLSNVVARAWDPTAGDHEGIDAGGLQHAVLSNIVLKDFRTGIQLKNEAGNDWYDVKISDTLIDGFRAYGVDANTGDGTTDRTGELVYDSVTVRPNAHTGATAVGLSARAQGMTGVAVINCDVTSPHRGINIEQNEIAWIDVTGNRVRSKSNSIRVVSTGGRKAVVSRNHVEATDSGDAILVRGIAKPSVTGNEIEEAFNRAIYIDGCDRAKVKGNTVRKAVVGVFANLSPGIRVIDNDVDDTTDRAVHLINCIRPTITDNRVDLAQYGIHVVFSNATYTPDNVLGVVLDRNTISRFGRNSTNRSAIWVQASGITSEDDLVMLSVSQNRAYLMPSDSAGTQVGILIQNPGGAGVIDHARLEGNLFFGVSTIISESLGPNSIRILNSVTDTPT